MSFAEEDDTDGFFFGMESTNSANKRFRRLKLPPTTFTQKCENRRPTNFQWRRQDKSHCTEISNISSTPKHKASNRIIDIYSN